MAAALPLVLRFVSIRQLDPAGRLEPIAWFALVPAVLALRGASGPGRAALLGLAAGLAYFFAAIHWVSHAMTAFGGLPLALAFLGLTLLVGYMAVHWAAAFAVSFTIRAQLGWPLWTHLPLVWAAFELCRNYFLTGFPWADLGYTQVRTTWVAQLAALGGVYLIAALVVLVNAVLAEVWAARREGAAFPRAAAWTACAAIAATLVHGAFHVAAVRARMAAAPTFSVGVVQPNVDQSRKNRARDNVGYILPRLVGPTVEADRAGADLVVWPEASFPQYLPVGTTSLAGFGSGIAPLQHAYLLAGAATVEWFSDDTGRRRARVGNVNLMVSPDLRILGSYQKHHLVPFGEYVPLGKYLGFLKQVVPSFAPSNPGDRLDQLSFPLRRPGPAAAADGTPALLAAPGQDAGGDLVRLAPMICFDAIFPEVNLAYARQGPEPEVLVNATNDAWYGHSSGPYQFLTIVQLRAIETGKAVIRAAYAGVSAVILPTGELAPGAIEVGPVEPEDAASGEPPRLLLADVPRLRGRTLYTMIGDLFAYGCAAFTAGALALAWWRRRRAQPEPRQDTET
jgi:apolipoprotein N-acyltransferase